MGVSGKIEPKWLLDGVIHGNALIVTPDAQLSTKLNFSKVESCEPTPKADARVVPEATDEPTDAQLISTYTGSKDPSFTLALRNIFRLGVAHGEQKVAARLPRLWGRWTSDGIRAELSSREDRLKDQCKVNGHCKCLIREFDPMTGGPKGA